MRVVDTEEDAVEMFETFHAKPSRRKTNFSFNWPTKVQAAGEAVAQLYRSAKWKKNPRDFEDYKHIAEALQTCYVVPGFLRDASGNKKLPLYGDVFDLDQEMPRHFTILATLIGIQIRLFEPSGRLPRGDKGLYEVTVPRGMLGGARFPHNGEAFLFVYTKLGGVHMLITGRELEVERDGITG